MPVTIDQFTRNLTESGLIPAAELQAISRHASFADAQELARELLRRKKLTRFQAESVYKGRIQGLVMGNYLVLDQIGAGGMGQVYKARHKTLDRVVALKVISKERLQNPTAVRRFHREIQTSAKLHHPHIVQAIDADEVGNNLMLVMEYVDGVDLAKKVKAEGPLPVDDACHYIAQAAMALQYAHESGMVHRDVKPQNLLLGKDGTLKLLDLGLARATECDDESTLTKEGTVVGTPDYIAPEQAMSAHTADIRADIYSLGATFYFLLTGLAPFPGGSFTEKLLKHQLNEPEPVEKLRPETPSFVASVLRKMMAKKPEDRFQIPNDVVRAIRSPGSQVNRTRRLPAILSWLGRSIRRRPKTWLVAAIVLLVLSANKGPKDPAADDLQPPSAKQPTELPDSKSFGVMRAMLSQVRKTDNFGAWQARGGTLVSSKEAHTMVPIPYTCDDRYKLKLVVQRNEGDGALVIGLSAKENACVAMVDGYPLLGYRTGLAQVNGAALPANDTQRKGQFLDAGETHEVVCIVEDPVIMVLINGKVIVKYTKGFARLSRPADWDNGKALFIGSISCSFIIKQVEITRSGPTKKPPKKPATLIKLAPQQETRIADLKTEYEKRTRLAMNREDRVKVNLQFQYMIENILTGAQRIRFDQMRKENTKIGLFDYFDLSVKRRDG